MKDRHASAISSEKIILSIIGGVTLLALVVIFIFSVNESKQGKPEVSASYKVNDENRPRVKVSSSSSDLGTMKVQDEKQAEFLLENTGNKPLDLFKISSSCDCTFGQITVNGTKSPEFGMHSKSTWSTSLEPGEKATLTVTYRPSIMPVKGPVTRDVYVQTNDPENPKLTFTVKAYVE
ncbi:DUF1573 domain-containing protein [Candidatus Gottesmanbacteria bacterium]|nr:DUF1573 domain-containing protein [Candidatus Gottesmanbacteria bacterium]